MHSSRIHTATLMTVSHVFLGGYASKGNIHPEGLHQMTTESPFMGVQGGCAGPPLPVCEDKYKQVSKHYISQKIICGRF